MGHEVGRNTVKRILAEHGIEARTREGQTHPLEHLSESPLGSYRGNRFLHRGSAYRPWIDSLLRAFVIDLETRRVEIAGIVHQPYDDWMKQIARNLTDAMDGFLSRAKNSSESVKASWSSS